MCGKTDTIRNYVKRKELFCIVSENYINHNVMWILNLFNSVDLNIGIFRWNLIPDLTPTTTKKNVYNPLQVAVLGYFIEFYLHLEVFSSFFDMK